ncbi:MAG: SEC-C metal-binding domain-containing protein, partial [Candidatus Sericytochromatia bacterium]
YSLLVTPWAAKPSGKLGGNDPCPCGSGKKYKGCCMRQVEDVNALGRRAEAPAGMPAGVRLARSVTDRRPTERSQAQTHRAIATEEFGSVDEVNAFIERHRKAGTLSSFTPQTASGQAQELVYDAWDAKTAKKRVSLAEKALAIDPDCADAYVVLADEQALSTRATTPSV